MIAQNVEIYVDIFKERSKRLLLLRKNQSFLTASIFIYKNDPIKFINDWAVTFDPELKNPVIPFVLFPKQEELLNYFLKKFQTRDDGVCKKTRKVGFTWLAVYFSVWLFLFYANQKIYFCANKASLVDCLGDPDSIFEKIRFAFRYLPPEFLPQGFSEKEHCLLRRILNPINSSAITGGAGDNMGRGGRSSIVFIDEAAHIMRPQKVDAALTANSDCKIYISTPNGVGNPFYQKFVGGVTEAFSFEWYDDPRKSRAWFDKQKLILDPVVFAQEVLGDFGASLSDVLIPLAWVQAAVNFNAEGLDQGQKIAGFDVADEGQDANALVIRQGGKIIYVEDWKEGTTTQSTRKAYATAKDQGAQTLFYDSIGVGAGVKGEATEIAGKVFDKSDAVNVYGVNVGKTPYRGHYSPGKKNEDMFLNIKAQLWWLVRRRFEKTYEHINNIRQYPVQELISIPNNTKLITELSQPKWRYNDGGQIQIESKKAMKLRGIPSPNIADALILSFARVVEPKIRTI